MINREVVFNEHQIAKIISSNNAHNKLIDAKEAMELEVEQPSKENYDVQNQELAESHSKEL